MPKAAMPAGKPRTPAPTMSLMRLNTSEGIEAVPAGKEASFFRFTTAEDVVLCFLVGGLAAPPRSCRIATCGRPRRVVEENGVDGGWVVTGAYSDAGKGKCRPCPQAGSNRQKNRINFIMVECKR